MSMRMRKGENQIRNSKKRKQLKNKKLNIY